jgi:hypothetical protein
MCRDVHHVFHNFGGTLGRPDLVDRARLHHVKEKTFGAFPAQTIRLPEEIPSERTIAASAEGGWACLMCGKSSRKSFTFEHRPNAEGAGPVLRVAGVCLCSSCVPTTAEQGAAVLDKALGRS